MWRNLHDASVSETCKAEWFKVIHDILPTHDRLHKIRLSPTNRCRNCPETDTIAHRILACGNGREIWHWTEKRLAQILNTSPDHIPDQWPTCPQFTLRPQQRNRAASWMMSTLITFRTQSHLDSTLQDYIEIVKSSRWKLSTKANSGEGWELYF